MRKIHMTRAEYKKVKRLDHKQMEEFVVNIYNDGYSDGRSTKVDIKPSDVAAAIADTPGIGTKKAADIMANVRKIFEEGETNESGTGGI